MNRRHLAAVLLVPALALTACGGDGGAEPTAAPLPASSTPVAPPTGEGPGEAPGTPSAVPSKVVNAFVACMRKQGVEVPDDVRTWKPDPQDERTQKALMACIGRSGAPSS
ncbi:MULTISPECIES: hypothetical protein [unclassified Spirillospora]|uniref:hypothetical protein n=1 Tax=unclassified Spirillospora TaxID=2642701 RepID=UPI003714A334